MAEGKDDWQELACANIERDRKLFEMGRAQGIKAWLPYADHKRDCPRRAPTKGNFGCSCGFQQMFAHVPHVFGNNKDLKPGG